MSRADPDDDLLTPTLDERYDSATVAAGGAAPWDPSTMVFATFFSLPLGAGVLYAINYRRLGQPRFALYTLLGVGACALAVVAAVWWAALQEEGKVPRAYLRLALTGLGFIAASLLSRHQKGPFRAWSIAGGEPRSVAIAALLAFVGNLLGLFVAFLLAQMLADTAK